MPRTYGRAKEEGVDNARVANDVEVLIDDASEARATGDRLRALDLLRRAATLAPDVAQIYERQGRILAELGRSKQAEWQFKSALSRHPTYWPAKVGLGLVLADMNQYEEARGHLLEAFKEAPDNIELRYLLGVVHVNLEDPDTAILHLKRAIALERTPGTLVFGPPSYWLGLALNQAGQPQDALDEFTAALLTSSASWTEPRFMWRLHWNIGVARKELKQFTSALDAFDRAAETMPELAPVSRVAIAEVRFAQGLYGEYWTSLYEAAAELPSQSAQAVVLETLGSGYLVLLGDVYRELGWLHKARETYLVGWRPSADSAPRRDQSPLHPGLGAGLLTTYFDSLEGGTRTFEAIDSSQSDDQTGGSYADALDVYQRTEAALKHHLADVPRQGTRTHVLRLLRLAWLHLVMGRLTDADLRLKEAARLNPQAVSDQFLINKYTGVIAARRGRHEDAAKSLERARELDPAEHEARVLLADAYLAAGSLERAETLYREVLKEAKDNTEAHIGLGRLLLERGDAGATDLYADAILHLEGALRIAESTRHDGRGRRRGSVRLTKGQVAALSYALALARVKMVEGGHVRGRARGDSLRMALEDLDRTLEYDPHHFHAAAAKRRLREDQSSRQQFVHLIPTILLLLLSIPAAIAVQLSFFFKWPREISPEWYVATTFGLLTFVAIAFYLRDLQKVKVGTLEVEKSAVQQEPAVTTFAMPKAPYPARASVASAVWFDEVRPRANVPEPVPSAGAKDAKMSANPDDALDPRQTAYDMVETWAQAPKVQVEPEAHATTSEE
jgi:tetratricopeptide (TPR) repeat protein